MNFSTRLDIALSENRRSNRIIRSISRSPRGSRKMRGPVAQKKTRSKAAPKPNWTNDMPPDA